MSKFIKSTVVLIVLFIGQSISAYAAFTTYSFLADKKANGYCSSNSDTSPATPTHEYLFAAISTTSIYCSIDSSGWAYYHRSLPPDPEYGYSKFHIYGTGFDIAGFDVRNSSGSALTATVDSWSTNYPASTDVPIASEDIVFPVGITTVNLSSAHRNIKSVLIKLSASNITGFEFNNFRLQPYVAVGTPVTLTPTTIAAPQVGVFYTQTFTAGGGSGSFTYSAPSGLIAGLTLNPTTGVLSGTPTTVGPVTFIVRATDSAAGRKDVSVTVTVLAPATMPSTPASIPTLSEWGVILLSFILVTLGVARMRRKPIAPARE